MGKLPIEKAVEPEAVPPDVKELEGVSREFRRVTHLGNYGMKGREVETPTDRRRENPVPFPLEEILVKPARVRVAIEPTALDATRRLFALLSGDGSFRVVGGITAPWGVIDLRWLRRDECLAARLPGARYAAPLGLLVAALA